MKSKILILCCVFCILLSLNALAVWQYDYGYDWNGELGSAGGMAINTTKMFDNDLNSYMYMGCSSGFVKNGYQFKYTKPTGALSAKIMWKQGNPATARNHTLPAMCFNSTGTFIAIMAHGYCSNNNNWRYMLQCVNSTTNYANISVEPYPRAKGQDNLNATYKPTTDRLYEVAVWWNINGPPTTPSTSSLNGASKLGQELIATGSGSTDSESNITYYYKFNCNSASGTELQALSTDNSWAIGTPCGTSKTIYVSVYAYDGSLYSTATVLTRTVDPAGPSQIEIDFNNNLSIKPLSFGYNATYMNLRNQIWGNYFDLTKSLNNLTKSATTCLGAKCPTFRASGAFFNKNEDDLINLTYASFNFSRYNYTLFVKFSTTNNSACPVYMVLGNMAVKSNNVPQYGTNIFLCGSRVFISDMCCNSIEGTVPNVYDGNFHDVALVLTSNITGINRWIKYYVDGKLIKKGNNRDFFKNNLSQNVLIGASLTYPAYQFDGIVKEVGLYDRELTAKEIELMHNQGNYTTDRLGRINKSIDLKNTFVTFSNISINRSWSYALWAKRPNLNLKYEGRIVNVNPNGALGLMIRFLNSSVQLLVKNSTGTITTLSKNSLNTDWNYISATYNSSGSLKLFLNGVQVNNTNMKGGLYGNTMTSAHELGRLGLSYNLYYFNGKLDDLKIYNYSLTAAEISDAYYQTAFYTSALFTQNISKTTFNQSITVTNIFEKMRCGFVTTYNKVNCTNVTYALTSLTNTTYCYVNEPMEKDVSIRMICNGATIKDQRSANKTINIDLMPPRTSYSVFNYGNNSQYLLHNITRQFNFTDAELFRWNVSIDGKTKHSAINVPYDSYSYNFSVNPKDFSSGIHTVRIQIADGHTANAIADYAITKGTWFDDKNLQIRTARANIKISALTEDSADIWQYQKQQDRYTFSLKLSPEDRDDVQLYTKAEVDTIKSERIATGIYNPPTKLKSDGLTLESDDGVIIKEGGEEPIEAPAEEIPASEYIRLQMKITADQPIYVVERPDSKYKTWMVIGDNWIDFASDEIDATATAIYQDLSDYTGQTYIVDLYHRGKLDVGETIQFNSIGDLNVINYNFTFTSVKFTESHLALVGGGSINRINMLANLTGTNYTFNDVSARVNYNNAWHTTTKTALGIYLINMTDLIQAPVVPANKLLKYSWNITIAGESLVQNFTQNVYALKISKVCPQTNYTTSLNICHQREDAPTVNITNITTNVNIDVLDPLNTANILTGFGFNFSSNTTSCYKICISPVKSRYNINAKIEYGNNKFAQRKYYLANYTLDNVSDTLPLYNLQNALASSVALTVYYQSTGIRIPDAYIKILRYYPQLDNGTTTAAYRTVEVERSDLTGQTIGKMVLTDVWYKFIVEKPIGNVLIDSDIEKIITTSKLLPVETTTSSLADYKTLLGITYTFNCAWETTKTCVFTWSNPTGAPVTGILRISQNTGVKKVLYNEQRLTSGTATLAYVIPENLTNKVWIAEGLIEQ